MLRFSFSPAESRLLNVIADPNAVKYTRRTAEANAALQNQVHQHAVSANQKLIAANPGGLEPGQANTGTRIASEERAKQMAALPMVDQFRNPTAAGVMNQAQRTASIPGQTTYSMETGAVTQGGQINAGAADRLIKNGMSVTEAQNRIDANKPDIQRTMSNTGLGGTARKSALEQQAEEYANAQVPGSAPGVGRDFNAEAQTKEQAKQAFYARVNAEQVQQDAQKKKAGDSAAANAVANDAKKGDGTEAPSNPEVSGLEAALAGLPPEYQALAPLFQGLIGSIEQGQSDVSAATTALLDANKTNSDKIDERLTEAENAQVAAAEKIQGMLDNLQKKQEANLTKQENAAKERLELTRMEQEQRIAVERRNAKESKIAEMAMKNRMGSDGALRELDEADQFYQKQWQNLQLETGVQRTEIAAKFSGLFLEAEKSHTLNTVQNIKDSLGAIERIGTQRNANTRARADAESSILQTMIGKQIDLRKELAKEKLNIGGQIIQTINQVRDDKRAQEQLGWQQLEWTFKTFGGANAPKSLVDSIAKMLPGVDVSDALQKMTLAEMKKKAGSGGGSGTSFNPSQYKSDGTPISFEDFVKQKEAEFSASNTADPFTIGGASTSTYASGGKVQSPTKFDRSATAMAQYKKEYEAKMEQENKRSPQAILELLDDRNKNITEKFQLVNRQATVDRYLKAGQYDLAWEYVDGLGKEATGEERKSFSKAALAKQNVNRVAALIEELGPMGPVIGRVRSTNPYDNRVVELNGLIAQTVPGLARGIFGEVGVLTDQDIKNYTATMANPNLTLDQARTATKNLIQTINLSVEDQLRISRAAGISTRDLRATFQTIPDYEFGQAAQAEDPDEVYARSIMLRP